MFIDANEIFRKNPALLKPDLSHLEAGCIVEISFKTTLFWCKVLRIDGDNVIAVVIDDLPDEFTFNSGNNIFFKTNNIFEIRKKGLMSLKSLTEHLLRSFLTKYKRDPNKDETKSLISRAVAIMDA